MWGCILHRKPRPGRTSDPKMAKLKRREETLRVSSHKLLLTLHWFQSAPIKGSAFRNPSFHEIANTVSRTPGGRHSHISPEICKLRKLKYAGENQVMDHFRETSQIAGAALSNCGSSKTFIYRLFPALRNKCNLVWVEILNVISGEKEEFYLRKMYRN